ncbi:MAG: protein-export chaperone SecB [Thiotrichales bacterium]
MADAAQDQQPQVVFEIQRVYLKDVSWETPNAPAIFTKAFKPATNVDLNSAFKRLAERVYEVDLNLTVTVKSEDETAYLVELKQSGIFSISGYPDDQLAQLLGSYCPNILYPFAREAISDLVVKGGFPQMLLAPINFDALYQQHLIERQKATENAAAAESTSH